MPTVLTNLSLSRKLCINTLAGGVGLEANVTSAWTPWSDMALVPRHRRRNVGMEGGMCGGGVRMWGDVVLLPPRRRNSVFVVYTNSR